MLSHGSRRSRRTLRWRGRRVPGRRGMTFLEVVAAVSVVALLASTVLGAVSYIHAVELRQTHLLACAELSNRMMLQYLDDKNALPSPITPLEYGAHRYRWSLSESPVGFSAVEAPSGEESGARVRGRAAIPPDKRYRLITVRVWLGEESGGTLQLSEGVPNARVSRLIDLLAFRNPDSAQNMLTQPDAMRQLVEMMQGGGQPTPTPLPGGTR